MERIYLAQAQAGATVPLDAETAHYLTRVLRVPSGSEVLAFDGEGREFIGILEDWSGRKAGWRAVNMVREEPEPSCRIVLAQGLGKQDKMALVIQKATELGVWRIRPFSCRRAVVKLDRKSEETKTERWRKIAEEACRQSRRCRLPVIDEPCSLEELLETATGSVLLAYEGEGTVSLASVFHDTFQDLTLIVGPEGGFEPSEVDGARRRGARLVSLGPRILRTETAGPAFLAIAQYAAGDMKGNP